MRGAVAIEYELRPKELERFKMLQRVREQVPAILRGLRQRRSMDAIARSLQVPEEVAALAWYAHRVDDRARH